MLPDVVLARQWMMISDQERPMFVRDADGAYTETPARPDALLKRARLPAGTYSVFPSDSPKFLQHELDTRSLFITNTREMRSLWHEVRAFFDPAFTQRMAAVGLVHSRGIILHGPPGTGKRSMVLQLLPFLIEQDAVVIVDCDPAYVSRNGIPRTRPNEPDRPIVLLNLHSAGVLQALDARLLHDQTVPDRLLVISCISDGARVLELAAQHASFYGCILEVNRLPDGVHQQLAAQKYPTLSCADRQFAVQQTSELPIEYLEEACTLLLMGYDPDEVRDRLYAMMFDSDRTT
jgi:hypothetical protein